MSSPKFRLHDLTIIYTAFSKTNNGFYTLKINEVFQYYKFQWYILLFLSCLITL